MAWVFPADVPSLSLWSYRNLAKFLYTRDWQTTVLGPNVVCSLILYDPGTKNGFTFLKSCRRRRRKKWSKTKRRRREVEERWGEEKVKKNMWQITFGLQSLKIFIVWPFKGNFYQPLLIQISWVGLHFSLMLSLPLTCQSYGVGSLVPSDQLLTTWVYGEIEASRCWT